mmetsp:Transcript_20422/g.36321  ORF Transcript_20422/g.36321 Transcript_20422/m.36321 type:complete len:104 (-) Transcript_20422:450-761(-)
MASRARRAGQYGSNLKVAFGVSAFATAFGLGFGGLNLYMHNKQMKLNYEEERRMALRELKLGTITKEEYDSLWCHKDPAYIQEQRKRIAQQQHRGHNTMDTKR